MRLIDGDKIIFHEIDEIGGEYEPYLGCSKDQICNLPTVEVIPKADYENRLKADMVAMLDEFDLRLYEQYDDTDLIKVKYVRQAIQQKINALRGDNE